MNDSKEIIITADDIERFIASTPPLLPIKINHNCDLSFDEDGQHRIVVVYPDQTRLIHIEPEKKRNGKYVFMIRTGGMREDVRTIIIDKSVNEISDVYIYSTPCGSGCVIAHHIDNFYTSSKKERNIIISHSIGRMGMDIDCDDDISCYKMGYLSVGFSTKQMREKVYEKYNQIVMREKYIAYETRTKAKELISSLLMLHHTRCELSDRQD